MNNYDSRFYDDISITARSSAEHIVPKLVTLLKPTSVIDIGCGTGTWLSVFQDNGVEDFLGIDCAAVPRNALEIPATKYVTFDLSRSFTCERQFDLAVSLEVAEHLPAHCSETFVSSLIRLSPLILFSAAIPGQGGTNHINERWQDYWAELFRSRGYIHVDLIRAEFWENRGVAWWYAQNALLYCEQKYARNSTVSGLVEGPSLPLRVVHPRKLEESVWRERLAHAALQIGRMIPPDSAFLLLDEGRAGNAFDDCGEAVAFPQKDGTFAGNPSSSSAAIEEMNELKKRANYLVILESSFWWMNYYSEWFDNLRLASRPLIDNEIIKVYQFKPAL